MGWFSKPKVPDYKPLAEANRYAADQQYKASQEAIGQWKSMYEQVREDTMPWRDAGMSALEEIQTGIESGAFEDDFSSPDVDFDKWSPEDYNPSDANIPGYERPDTQMPEWKPPNADDLQLDPGYIFRTREGLKSIRREAASVGLSGSGATLKALQRYGQESASEEFTKARDRSYQDYQTRYGESLMERNQSIEDYRLEVESGLGERARDIQDYGINRQAKFQDYETGRMEALSERERAIQDYVIRQGENEGRYNRLAGLAGSGQVATRDVSQYGMQSTGQQSRLSMEGAAAQGAGAIGAANTGIMQTQAQNAAGQQGFNNLLSVVGLGTKVAGIW